MAHEIVGHLIFLEVKDNDLVLLSQEDPDGVDAYLTKITVEQGNLNPVLFVQHSIFEIVELVDAVVVHFLSEVNFLGYLLLLPVVEVDFRVVSKETKHVFAPCSNLYNSMFVDC